MKYVEHRMSVDTGSPASSVQTWLGKELEVRGIDAVIYTRYILSILQQDSFDMEHSDAHFFPPCKKSSHVTVGGGVSAAGKGRRSGGGLAGSRGDWKQQLVHGGKSGKLDMNPEERKKSAAVECLLSVSDEDAGIERLVEELYHKLKEHKSSEATASPFSDLDSHIDVKKLTPFGTPEDPAEKYYAAFPPLKEPGDGSTVVPSCICENQTLWSRVAQKLQSANEKGQSQNAAGVCNVRSARSGSVDADRSGKHEESASEDGKKENQLSIFTVDVENANRPVDDDGAVRFFRYGSCERCLHLKSLLGMSILPEEGVNVAGRDDSLLYMKNKQSPGWKDVNADRPVFLIPKVDVTPNRVIKDGDLVVKLSESQTVTNVCEDCNKSSDIQFADKDAARVKSPDCEGKTGTVDQGCHDNDEEAATEVNRGDISWYTELLGGLFSPLQPDGSCSDQKSPDELESDQISGSLQQGRLYDRKSKDCEKESRDCEKESWDCEKESLSSSQVLFPSLFPSDLFSSQEMPTDGEDDGDFAENKSRLLKYIKAPRVKFEEDGEHKEDTAASAAFSPSVFSSFLDQGDDAATFATFSAGYRGDPGLQISVDFSCSRDDMHCPSDFADSNALFPLSSFSSICENILDLSPNALAEQTCCQSSVLPVFPCHKEEPIANEIDPSLKGAPDVHSGGNATEAVKGKAVTEGGERRESLEMARADRVENLPDQSDGVRSPSPLFLPRLFETSRFLKLFHGEDEESTSRPGEREESENPCPSSDTEFSYGNNNNNEPSVLAVPVSVVQSLTAFSFDEVDEGESFMPDVMLMSSETVDSDSGIADDKPSGDDECVAGILSSATDEEDAEVDDLGAACDVDRLVNSPGVTHLTWGFCQEDGKTAGIGSLDSKLVHDHPRSIEITIPSLGNEMTQIDSDTSTPKVSFIDPVRDDYVLGIVSSSNGEELKTKPVWHSDRKHASVWESRLLDLDTTTTTSADLQLTLHDYDFCDKCRSNRSSASSSATRGSQLPVGNSRYSGTGQTWPCCGLTPTDVHSYSTWYDLHATDSTYDDDRPLKDLLESIISSPPKKYLHRNHNHFNSLIPTPSSTESSSSISSSLFVNHNTFHHLWDVNSQKYHTTHDFEQFKMDSKPPMVDVIKENVLGFGLNNTEMSEDLFIQGGLYGSGVIGDRNIWDTSQAKSSETSAALTGTDASAAADDEVFVDAEENQSTQWQKFGETLKLPTAYHKSTSLSELCSDGNEEFLLPPPPDHTRHLSTSSEILPSECSAFQDNIPPRLPHVCSEPFLSLRTNLNDHGTLFSELKMSRCRFVQVRHLFRSESFLAQYKHCSGDACAGIAGLSAEIGVRCQDSEERQDLLFSPDTHFRPIQTPKSNTPTQMHDSASSSCGAQTSYCKDSSEETENILIVDGESYQVYRPGTIVGVSVSSSSSSARNVESTQSSASTTRRKFVPKFKVKTDWEKFSQTEHNAASSSSSSKCATPDVQKTALPLLEGQLQQQEDEGAILARLTAGISDVLQLDSKDALTEEYAEEEEESATAGSDLLTATACDTSHVYTDPLSSSYPANLSHAELSTLWSEGEVDIPVEYANDAASSLNRYRNIWSVGDSFDCIGSLPASLPKVTDLNQTRLYADISMTTDEDDCDTSKDAEMMSGSMSYSTSADDDGGCSKSWAAYDMAEEQMFPFDFELGGAVDGLAWYSSDLEGEWLSSDMPFEVQVPRKKRQKQGAYKKPCSFFLEGQCRRSDCKFAHDTSNITCRFWEEGDCFKGITCPFLHGYPSENVVNAENPKPGDFCLETEDFPELSKSQEEQLVRVTSKPVKKRSLKKASFSTHSSTKEKDNSSSQNAKKLAGREKSSRAKSLPIEIKPKK